MPAEPIRVTRALTGWVRGPRLGDKGWEVSRGRRVLGVVYLGTRGRWDATVLGSPRHHSARVPTVAAGVRWVVRRAPGGG